MLLDLRADELNLNTLFIQIQTYIFEFHYIILPRWLSSINLYKNVFQTIKMLLSLIIEVFNYHEPIHCMMLSAVLGLGSALIGIRAYHLINNGTVVQQDIVVPVMVPVVVPVPAPVIAPQQNINGLVPYMTLAIDEEYDYQPQNTAHRAVRTHRYHVNPYETEYWNNEYSD
jgi:hypothetical protein